MVEEVTTARCVLNLLHPATYSISRWLDDYNFNRPHGSLGYAPLISRAAATVRRLERSQVPSRVDGAEE